MLIIWRNTTNDAVAFFTFWLAVFSCMLVIVATFQVWLLLRAEHVAKSAAEAAKQSVDATLALERPYLFAAEGALVRPSGITNPSPHIIYSITNLGRVPGVIRMIYAEAIPRGTDPLDPIATYRKDKFTYAQTPLGGGYKTIPTLPASFDEAVSEQDYTDVKDGKKMILLKILLVYSGALDFTYYSAVAYRIDIITGSNYPVGGYAYNYEETEKGRPSAVTKITPKIRIVP